MITILFVIALSISFLSLVGLVGYSLIIESRRPDAKR